MISREKVKEGFKGTVVLKESFRDPVNQKWVVGICGILSVCEDKDAVGFHVSDRESNWVVQVKGTKGNYYFLGCQIRGFVEHDSPAQCNEYLNA